MKAIILPVCLAAAVLTVAHLAHSQAPAVPQNSLQKLQAIQAKNKALIEKQTVTLQKLEELQLEAQQLKFLGKRS